MKIYPVIQFGLAKQCNNKPQNSNAEQKEIKLSNTYLPNYNDYLLSFGARVDKGLERFYKVNCDRMPQTVKTYIENLDDKSQISPLEAQKNAYELLEICQSIEDIQSAYPAPEETLFTDLINPRDSRATRGIINCIKDNEELLTLYNRGILKDKSNLTVYLVKKIFLENKTIEEINQDLDKDLDEDFKIDFKYKNKKAQYIYPSTINALGIKVPDFEYRQSLRYTADGYSDLVGSKISEGQRAFWDSLSFEEKTARAKKSVQKFEGWWTGLTRSEILEMIANDENELDMLTAFKKSQHAGKKNTKNTKENKADIDQETETPKRTHIKVGSEKLSQDELFKKWASNKLKLYKEHLTEAEKDSIHILRMRKLASRWAKMTPAERTDYISKMKAGSEPLKYTMIDAWNHSIDLIKDLSGHLRANQIYRPADLLYSTQEFSEFQSQVMTEFWATHPNHATELGEQILRSQEKVQNAISNGTFEALKKQIIRDKNQRQKEIAAFKTRPLPQVQETPDMPEYMVKFKEAYYQKLNGQLRYLPQNYINDYFKSIQTGFSQEQIEAWTKNINGENVSDEEVELLKQIAETEPPEGARINRALEAALANVLYPCTKSPDNYKLSHSDLKTILNQIKRGEKNIDIYSHKLKAHIIRPIFSRDVDLKKLQRLYNEYIQPLSDDEIDAIVDEYFISGANNNLEQLTDYLKLYGSSLKIIFSDKSVYPKEIKEAMFEKFMSNMPSGIEESHLCLIATSDKTFEREEEIRHFKNTLRKRFNFIPAIYMDKYLTGIGFNIRKDPSADMTGDIQLAAKKRTNIKDRGKLMILPKGSFSTLNKLRSLAMEQTLADILYNATENPDVYKLQFEELCDNIELFSLVKKFPTEKRTFKTISGDIIELSAKHKLNNIYQIQKNYLEYINEIIDWVNTDVKEGKGTLEDLVYILNPDENKSELDDIVASRIKKYGLNLQ